MNALLPLYVRTENFLRDQVDRLRNPDDRGQAIIEYLAIVVFVVAIGLLLIQSQIGQNIKTAIETEIGKLTGGGGGGGKK